MNFNARRHALLFVTAAVFSATAFAQSSLANSPQLVADSEAPPALAGAPDAASSSSSTTNNLPDAPSVALHGFVMEADQTAPGRTRQAPYWAAHIASDEIARPLDARDKIILTMRGQVTLVHFGSVLASAGWSHVRNSSPNYGTDKGAFGERLGAGAIHGLSQDIFERATLAPILHTDQRYYVMGRSHNFGQRAIYIVSRVFVTRTDSGKSTVNAPLLIGYAGAAALTRTYYPEVNRNFSDVASGYGSSLGGAAIGYALDEFSDDLLRAVHLHREKK